MRHPEGHGGCAESALRFEFRTARPSGGAKSAGFAGDFRALNRTGRTSDCGNCEPRYLLQGIGAQSPARAGREQHYLGVAAALGWIPVLWPHERS